MPRSLVHCAHWKNPAERRRIRSLFGKGQARAGDGVSEGPVESGHRSLTGDLTMKKPISISGLDRSISSARPRRHFPSAVHLLIRERTDTGLTDVSAVKRVDFLLDYLAPT